MANLLINSDNVVTLSALEDSISAAFINNATVTGVLYDRTGALVAGSTFNLTYVAASNGVYQGVIAHSITAALPENQEYTVEVTASVGGFQLVIRNEYPTAYAGK